MLNCPSIVLAFASLLSLGCTSEVAGGRYGYIAVGSDARRWGFVGDTLWERPRARVPQQVQRTADQIAHDAAANPQCNRFFGDGPYLVQVGRSCGEYSQTHDLSHVAIDSAGVRVTQPEAWFTGYWSHFCPVDRAATGNAWPEGQRC